MRKLDEVLTKTQVRAMSALDNFKTSEDGDTNFVSMLLIIGIVVVLAGLFLNLGKGVMESITDKIQGFIDGL